MDFITVLHKNSFTAQQNQINPLVISQDEFFFQTTKFLTLVSVPTTWFPCKCVDEYTFLIPAKAGWKQLQRNKVHRYNHNSAKPTEQFM